MLKDGVGRELVSVLINFLVAVFGTAIIDAPFTHYLLPLRASIWSAIGVDAFELVFSCALGLLVYLRWRPTAARWVWVPGVLLFFVGLALTRTSTLWAFWDFNKDPALIDPARVAQWSVFAAPFVRTVGYALSADLCSRAGRSG